MLWQFLLLATAVSTTLALNNGLARTPPMGWTTWQRFRCVTDCEMYPKDCISQDLIKRMADIIRDDGYRDAGYVYLGVDDCWMEKERGWDGRLIGDRLRFPCGMKALAEYVHDRGLKFGIYANYGNLTCSGYPGSLGYEQIDVDTLVGWDVDWIRLDGCYSDNKDMDIGFPDFGAKLNESGRPILYSCSWPAYQEYYHKGSPVMPDYRSIAKHCNVWRNYADIDDSWQSLKKIINWYGDNQAQFAPFGGPGHWNDPDMLLTGNYGLSLDQTRVQFALWAVMPAPLIMSVDLETIRPEFKEILQNSNIIAVNQDPDGRPGFRVLQRKDTNGNVLYDVWSRELSQGAIAIAFVSYREDGVPYKENFTYPEMRLPNVDFDAKDLYDLEETREMKPDQNFTVTLNPTGVKFYKLDRKLCDDV